MKTVEIIGYKRANLGKSVSQRLRDEGNVPCVLYGGGTQVHFYSPMILFRELVYTNEAHFVHLNIEGEESQAILQDIQFHPVSEVILHADFLRIAEDRKIKMSIPTRLVGQSPGVGKGGTLVRKMNALTVRALPKDIPDHIDVDVSQLDFHHAVKVADVVSAGLEFVEAKSSPIAVVEVPRAAKMADEAAAATAVPVEGAAAAPGATPEPKKEEGKK
ncbi:MAG TPA: 50S ribosomal protein L25/general stress protein Ctc [Cyclobacteriaceae bacterium]